MITRDEYALWEKEHLLTLSKEDGQLSDDELSVKTAKIASEKAKEIISNRLVTYVEADHRDLAQLIESLHDAVIDIYGGHMPHCMFIDQDVTDSNYIFMSKEPLTTDEYNILFSLIIEWGGELPIDIKPAEVISTMQVMAVGAGLIAAEPTLPASTIS